MACKSCKKTNAEIYNESVESVSKSSIFEYVSRFMIFILLCIIILPFIIPITIYALFVTTVLDKGINLVPALVYLGKKMFKDDEDDGDEFENEEDGGDDFENDEDYDDLSDAEYELVNDNEITIIK